MDNSKNTTKSVQHGEIHLEVYLNEKRLQYEHKTGLNLNLDNFKIQLKVYIMVKII